MPNSNEHSMHATALKSLIDGDVRFDRHHRMLYATDASIYQVEPIGVVIPRHDIDVANIINYAKLHQLALLPRGAGTSLAGQTTNHAIIIDFSVYMNAMIAIDESHKHCEIQPGIVLSDLNSQIAAATDGRLWFGPDVATANRATLGGMIGNNSAGMHSVKYGRTLDHVLNLKVKLSDGSTLQLYKGAATTNSKVRAITQQIADILIPIQKTIKEKYPIILRRVDGYCFDVIVDQILKSKTGTFDQVNLAHLLCGSEGTLGITTEATLNLVDVPKCKGLAILAFPTIDDAVRQVPGILSTQPAAIELLDNLILTLAKRNITCKPLLNVLPKNVNSINSGGVVLYVEYFGDNDNDITDAFKRLSDLGDNIPIVMYQDTTSMDAAWQLRKAGEPLLHAIPGLQKPIGFVEDTAVDPNQLPEFVREFRAIVEKYNTQAAFYAHASVGCLHIRPLLNLHEQNDRNTMREIATEVTQLVCKYHGSLSGEHGNGRARSALLRNLFGSEIIQAMQQVKKVFDPANLMNPGMLIEQVSMVQKLRVLPNTIPCTISDADRTFYKYDSQGGFAEAVEQCNGAAACRKTDSGTMCPSYITTHDERHSTRGRANALRLTLSNQLHDYTQSDSSTSQDALKWNDPDMIETLSSCLSCKACKSECPSNVDVAKLKAEYTAQSFQHGRRIPLANLIFGNINHWNRIGSMIRYVANPLLRAGPIRSLVNKMLGIDSKRSLPVFSKPFGDQYAKVRCVKSKDLDQPVVLLFVDCFTKYNEPEVGLAAASVLQSLGYYVQVVHHSACCGRAMISNSLLMNAIHTITHSAKSILDMIDQYKPTAIIVCEPSCLSAIKDDWLELKIGIKQPEVARIADMSYLPEQFIIECADAHPNNIHSLFDQPLENPIAVHTHCHQKAVLGTKSSTAIFDTLWPGELQTLDTGCCGMAGVFGYDKKTAQLSREIANVSLLSEIKKLSSKTTILVPGISCRQQIRDLTDSNPIHPIQFLNQSINDNRNTI